MILELVDDAVRGGASHLWACSVLGVCDDRAHRWRRRKTDTGDLSDLSSGGVALHAPRPAETAEILGLVQRLRRPRTPIGQAWIESLFGHIKAEWPHLEDIRDPAVLDTELQRARSHYNSVRLHASIGYVTPDDEHTGRGEHIRQARTEGPPRARQQRIDYHRRNHLHNNPHHSP